MICCSYLQDRHDTKDATTDTSHMAIMTDPDCLGPCEPGTSVVLEGIVWQETENGSLLDCVRTYERARFVASFERERT